MASAEIVTIGTELLLGQLVDTNTAVIAQALAGVGMDVHRQTSVGDNEVRIIETVSEAMARCEAVICAGGLGPTVDDMTRAALARATGRPLERRQEIVDELQAFFASVRRAMSANNELQAYVPRGAIVMDNPHGTAPGFIVDTGACAVLALPGPPRELIPMLHDHAIPWLVKRFGLRSIIVTRVLKTLGVAESAVDARIADLFRKSQNPSIAVLAHPGQVDVKITAKAPTREQAAELIGSLEPLLRERLGDCIFGVDGDTIEGALGQALRERGWTIGVAESCTGGMIGASITSVPGSSAYFRGGLIAYADQIKSAELDVPAELIRRHGAVSEEVAAAMARGARRRFDATIALADTGIAGPGGGTPKKPVGLVYIALAGPHEELELARMMLPGDRELIRRRATLAALQLGWKAARRSKT